MNVKDSRAAQRRAQHLMLNIKTDNFTPPYVLIYKAVLIYYRTVEAVIPYDRFVDLAKRQNLSEEEFNQAIQAFVELHNGAVVEEHEFRYAVIQLKQHTKQDKFTEAMVDSMDVMMTGKRVGQKLLYGYDAAFSYMQKRMADLSRSDDADYAGLTNKDMTKVLQNYSDRKFGRKRFFPTGFGEIDEACSGGFQQGELVFLAGYTSEGKSTLLNTLVDGWVYGSQKLNVVLGTAEHPPEVVQRKLASIRSCDPKYGGALNYKRLKEGRLDGQEERILERVIQDSSSDNYGNLVIFPIPENATATSVFNIVEMYNQLFPVDIFAYDYIGYSQGDRQRNTDREEMGQVVRTTKIRASNFDNKRGIATVSPFQVSRGKWEKAVVSGFYTLACMEETSAAEKAADEVWSVLHVPEQNKTLGQLLKNRDGPKWTAPFEMTFDVNGVRFVPKAKQVSL
jgi:replicative DNA helicase